MPAAAELRVSDGFRVESPRGRLGVVEEVWVGDGGEPEALAVRTVDGRHGLVLVDEVDAVLVEQEQVVVEEPTLLELEPPHVDGSRRDGGIPRLTASWTTTGEVLPLPEPGRLRLPFTRTHLDAAAPQVFVERPLWQMVAILYGSITLIAVVVCALAFLVPLLVVGHAY
jgi:hypothetical protein